MEKNTETMDMSYVLESQEEFSRLEDQSKLSLYDYKEELKHFNPAPGQTILDAGCGSGVVSRYIAEQHPKCQIVACDAASGRLAEAEQHSKDFKNLKFKEANLTELNFEENTFDWIICRYVIEHIHADDRAKAIREVHRCLKPGGTFIAIDFDGLFHNTYPTTERIERGLVKLLAAKEVDLQVGRKMPVEFHQGGFKDVHFEILTKSITPEERLQEVEIIRQRMDNARTFLVKTLGSDAEVDSFKEEYLSVARDPSSVIFYNKFLVTAKKQRRLEVVS